MNSIFEHDATPTWSGFIYQGYVAIYLAVRKICELLEQNALDKKTIGLTYQLEVENLEDVAIVKMDGKIKHYISIHQVKHRKEKKISDYKNPLIQLMLEKGYSKKQNMGVPEAYLHTSSSIKENDENIEKLLGEWKDNIIEFRKNLNEFIDRIVEEVDMTDFQREVKEEIKKEPIGLNRTKYKDLLADIKGDKVYKLEQLKDKIKELCKYLDEELAVYEIDTNVKLFRYNNNNASCDIEKLFEEIVKQIKNYKKLIKNQENLTKEQYEYIADKLLCYMRNHISERHQLMQKNKKYERQFLFKDIVQILDQSILEYETKANIMVLRRKYDEALAQYCRVICKNVCENEKDYECKLLNLEYCKTDLNDEDFKKLCFSYNPDCDKEIGDRSCLFELLKKEGLQNSVFKVLEKVPDGYFIKENDKTRVVINNQQNNAFLTAIAHDNVEVVVEDIIGGIINNTKLVSQIFEADELVTARLQSDDGTVWDNDYSEITEKYLSTEAIMSSDDNKHSICNPKKPRFVTANEIIKNLV